MARGIGKKLIRIDRQRVTNINQKCEGSILQVIRMLKYWNRRSTAPSMLNRV